MAKKPSEKDIAKQQARLRVKYPQMYKDVEADVSYLANLPPGLRKDLEVMVTKKLKKIYGG